MAAHTFTGEQTRAGWRHQADALRTDFLLARDDVALARALARLANSRGNPHCAFRPYTAAPEVRLVGIEFARFARGAAEETEFVVGADVEIGGSPRIRPGDKVLAMDGVPIEALRAGFVVVAPTRRGYDARLARWLSRRPATEASGSHASIRLRRSDGAIHDVDVRWRQKGEEPASDWLAQDAPDYATISTLLAKGHHAELYSVSVGSAKGSSKRMVIVRLPSFQYIAENWSDAAPGRPLPVVEDEQLVRRVVGEQRPELIVVDLRANRGGNNPSWILSYLGNAQFNEELVRLRLFRNGSTDFIHTFVDHADMRWYMSQLSSVEGDWSLPTPFLEHPVVGTTELVMPRARQPVPLSSAPISLLVGPWCASSCELFTRRFQESRMGLVAGEPTLGATTSRRANIVVVSPFTGNRLGEYPLAVSLEQSGSTAALLDGHPLVPDILVGPRLFETKADYSRNLIEHVTRMMVARGTQGLDHHEPGASGRP